MAKTVVEFLDKLYEEEAKPLPKIQKEQSEDEEKEDKGDDKVVDEGALGQAAHTVANIAVPMVAGSYGGIGGAIAASSAMQMANQALAKRKAAKAAQAQQQSGVDHTDAKYQHLAAQRAPQH